MPAISRPASGQEAAVHHVAAQWPWQADKPPPQPELVMDYILLVAR
jgi:hypothetical protein